MIKVIKDLLLVLILEPHIHVSEFGLIIKLKSLLMIKVTELHLPMLLSLILKDFLVMLLKIKLLETQQILFLMLNVLLDVSLTNKSFKGILSYGLSRLNLALMISPSYVLSIRERIKSSILKKLYQWYSPRWKKQPNHILESKLRMLLSLFPLIAMTLKDKPPRMLVLLLVLTFFGSSTKQLLLQLLMDLIRKQNTKNSFLSSISEVVLSMSHFLQLKMVFSKSEQLLVIITWEV